MTSPADDLARLVSPDGWNYTGHPEAGTDARKLVTLTEGGMMWIGIRAWNTEHGYWMNGGEPERVAKVKAWRDLPEIARGFWDRGKLVLSATVKGKADE